MSNPFVVGQNGVSSGTSLVINVANSTATGDTLQIGVSVNTTGVVRVTDTQGNTWTQILSDVTNTGAQLWVFEALSAAALIAGTDTITVTVSTS